MSTNPSSERRASRSFSLLPVVHHEHQVSTTEDSRRLRSSSVVPTRARWRLNMAFSFTQSSDLLERDSQASVVCVRVLIDVRATPYLKRASTSIAALPASSAKVRAAAALLRRLRSGWIAVGTFARRMSSIEAGEADVRWRTPQPADVNGDATLATLIVLSRSSLLLNGPAHSVEGARGELEALSSVYVDDVLDVELIVDSGSVRSADALQQLREPSLHEVEFKPSRFCASCGLPLDSLARGTERCVDCAAPLRMSA